jgi:hypothetical protein
MGFLHTGAYVQGFPVFGYKLWFMFIGKFHRFRDIRELSSWRQGIHTVSVWLIDW